MQGLLGAYKVILAILRLSFFSLFRRLLQATGIRVHIVAWAAESWQS
jgi:hypothetical protein